MRHPSRILLWLILPFTVPMAAGAEGTDDPETFFELKVRPVLAGKCFTCHGGKKVSNGLRVDTRAALLKGGEDGPALVPGDPDASLLIRALRHTDDDLRMPPDRKLPDAVVADFSEWIRRGAIWPDARAGSASPFVTQAHWAFEPVKAVDPPRDPSGWADHPIDRFLAAKREEHGVKPVAPADRGTLLRRVTFDLTGLPPTPEEIAEFDGDDSPAAFAKVVERLLASPRYGERWGRHWMDVVRYADTAGDNADYPIPEARRYRDYIIDAFNADMPYDRFVREQLAGDILAARGGPEAYAGPVIATGFLALSRRYATAPEELWHLTLEDTIETTGRAFLGLTLRCARCHDHKFDPVTKEDYYALYGIFASTKFPYAGSEEFQSKGFPRAGFQPLVPPDQARPGIEANRRRIEQLRGEIERAKKGGPSAAAQLRALESELRTRERPGLPPDMPGAYAVREGKPGDEAVHLRGEPAARGPVVKRNVPRFLAGRVPPVVPDDASGRLTLAEWLTRPENPLTARVMVNRIWQHHFGRGIVATPSNFGSGEPPTHPELLDWLAARFVAEGWSIKAMHRLIVNSKSYRLSGGFDPDDAAKDPGNKWHWRHERSRLEAEAIRDAMLAVSGALDANRPGPHPFPPIDQWGWTQHSPFKAVYPSSHRSVYLMTQRLQRHPFLALFDGPDTNHSTESRTRATIPLQSLYLRNNPFVHDQAEALARRLISASSEDRSRVANALLLAWGRPPAPGEVDECVAFVRACADRLAKEGVSAAQVEVDAWAGFARVLFASNEFLYID